MRMRYRQAYTTAAGGDFVYVIQSPHAVKVGVTRNLEERLATLQTGSPHTLTLAYHLLIAGDAYAVEAEAHATLNRHRLEGEWFAVAPSLAVAAINEAAYRLGSGSREEESRPPRSGLRRSFLIAFFLFFANLLPAFAPWPYSGPWVLLATFLTGLLYFTARAMRGTLVEQAPSFTEFFLWIGLALVAFVLALISAAVCAGVIWGSHRG